MLCCSNKDTGIVDDSEPLTVTRKVPMWDHCSAIFWENGCAKAHLCLLIVYLAILVAFVSVFSAKFNFLQNPNALCVSLGRDLFIDFTIVLASSVCFEIISLLVLMCMKVEGFPKARRYLWWILVGFSILVRPSAFILAVVPGLYTYVLISGPNDTYYRCSFNFASLDGSIISSSDITNSTDMNQTCQFWTVKQLCEDGRTSFNVLAPPFITINETLGAYSCLPSSSMGLDLCRAYIASTHSVWIAVVICFPCSFPWIWALNFWIKDTSKLRYCEKCYDIWQLCICLKVCTCCEEYKPILTDEKPRSASTAGGT
jgi:hypothetical protein